MGTNGRKGPCSNAGCVAASAAVSPWADGALHLPVVLGNDLFSFLLQGRGVGGGELPNIRLLLGKQKEDRELWLNLLLLSCLQFIITLVPRWCTLGCHILLPISNILQNYSQISPTGCWHWHGQDTERFHQHPKLSWCLFKSPPHFLSPEPAIPSPHLNAVTPEHDINGAVES